MDLSKSLKPIKGFDKVLSMLKKSPLQIMSAFALPGAAFAASDVPPGFDDFSPIRNESILQNMIQVNKDCIIFAEQFMHQLTGLDGGSVGLAIFAWSALIHLFTYPLYEPTIKYPAEFEKAVQNVIEAQLKRSNPNEYTYENDKQEESANWTNP